MIDQYMYTVRACVISCGRAGIPTCLQLCGGTLHGVWVALGAGNLGICLCDLKT